MQVACDVSRWSVWFECSIKLNWKLMKSHSFSCDEFRIRSAQPFGLLDLRSRWESNPEAEHTFKSILFEIQLLMFYVKISTRQMLSTLLCAWEWGGTVVPWKNRKHFRDIAHQEMHLATELRKKKRSKINDEKRTCNRKISRKTLILELKENSISCCWKLEKDEAGLQPGRDC